MNPYKVGDRVSVRTNWRQDAPRVTGTIIAAEDGRARFYNNGQYMYTVKLDKPSRIHMSGRMKDPRYRPNRNIWMTDSSMAELIPVLEDLARI